MVVLEPQGNDPILAQSTCLVQDKLACCLTVGPAIGSRILLACYWGPLRASMGESKVCNPPSQSPSPGGWRLGRQVHQRKNGQNGFQVTPWSRKVCQRLLGVAESGVQFASEELLHLMPIRDRQLFAAVDKLVPCCAYTLPVLIFALCKRIEAAHSQWSMNLRQGSFQIGILEALAAGFETGLAAGLPFGIDGDGEDSLYPSLWKRCTHWSSNLGFEQGLFRQAPSKMDPMRCMAVRAHRRLKAIFDGSVLLQYHLAAEAACADDNPFGDMDAPDRLSALQRRQTAFAELLPTSIHIIIPMDNFPVLSEDALSSGIFVMAESSKKALRWVSLASIGL
ncbi:hypothetical protein K438DRAFT_1935377 [Mycena galopus ATCC 62051]|nr:hypothetical protein K438DRAFT_1935377 [Mycena galopus ATCC 62051]